MAKRKRSADDIPTATARSPKRKRLGQIEQANCMGPTTFLKQFLDPKLLVYHASGKASSCISVHFAEHIGPDDFNACFDLIETTSRGDYEASTWQWHPKRKRREMKEPEMRYIIVRSDTSGAFEGFISVMLTHDSTPVVPVLYIYEIHLSAEARGKGLGGHLMVLAEDVARRAGVAKVMLTCFRSNVKAREFYERRGYAADASSPRDVETRHRVHKHDYVILSKNVRSISHDEADEEVSTLK